MYVLDNEDVKCSICLNEWIERDPRMLPCQHIFCLQCLIEGQELKECPLCRFKLEFNSIDSILSLKKHLLANKVKCYNKPKCEFHDEKRFDTDMVCLTCKKDIFCLRCLNENHGGVCCIRPFEGNEYIKNKLKSRVKLLYDIYEFLMKKIMVENDSTSREFMVIGEIKKRLELIDKELCDRLPNVQHIDKEFTELSEHSCLVQNFDNLPDDLKIPFIHLVENSIFEEKCFFKNINGPFCFVNDNLYEIKQNSNGEIMCIRNDGFTTRFWKLNRSIHNFVISQKKIIIYAIERSTKTLLQYNVSDENLIEFTTICNVNKYEKLLVLDSDNEETYLLAKHIDNNFSYFINSKPVGSFSLDNPIKNSMEAYKDFKIRDATILSNGNIVTVTNKSLELRRKKDGSILDVVGIKSEIKSAFVSHIPYSGFVMNKNKEHEIHYYGNDLGLLKKIPIDIKFNFLSINQTGKIFIENYSTNDKHSLSIYEKRLR